jgi:hypothetical protein
MYGADFLRAASRLNDPGSSTIRLRLAVGSSTGIAERSARGYGCAGASKSRSVVPISTIVPFQHSSVGVSWSAPRTVREKETRWARSSPSLEIVRPQRRSGDPPNAENREVVLARRCSRPFYRKRTRRTRVGPTNSSWSTRPRFAFLCVSFAGQSGYSGGSGKPRERRDLRRFEETIQWRLSGRDDSDGTLQSG